MHTNDPSSGRETIGFDLDDVLLEFFPVFAKVLAREHGLDVAHVERQQWDYIAIPEITDAGLNLSDVRRIVHQACHDKAAHQARPVLSEATADTVRRLRRDGHRVVLTTARPPTSAAVVAAWLEEVGIVLDELRFGASSKRTVDVLVEDSREQAEAAADAGVVVFVPDRPWNRHEALDARPNVVRVVDPAELYPRMRAHLDGLDDPFGFQTAAAVGQASEASDQV